MKGYRAHLRKHCQPVLSGFEWIVVDGGSTDGSLEVIKHYKERIDILISEPDNGIYDAMNKGIRLAKGKWINFMNGGDTFADSGIVGDFLRFAGDNPAADVIYGDFNRMLPDGGVRKSEFPDVVDKVFFTINRLIIRRLLSGAVCFGVWHV